MRQSLEWSGLVAASKELIISHQQSFPVPVGSIAKEFGLIVKSSSMPAGISGEIKETNKVVTIKVNRHDVKARQRFTLAHEIAHYLLHRHLLSDGITDDILYRSSLSDVIEAQANRLAADIVMPISLIRDSLAKHADLKEEQRYEAIAEEAQISTIALKIRLGKR